MSPPEVPLEQTQEDLQHHAHAAAEPWILGVALTAALLAVFAAVTALLAEHHAHEALIRQIQSSDQWNFYQAKSIKGHLAAVKNDVLAALGKPPSEQDAKDQPKYEKEKVELRNEAEQMQRDSEAHLRQHSTLALAITMFQVGIAVGAISVLTRRKEFWLVSMAFGLVGVVFMLWGSL